MTTTFVRPAATVRPVGCKRFNPTANHSSGGKGFRAHHPGSAVAASCGSVSNFHRKSWAAWRFYERCDHVTNPPPPPSPYRSSGGGRSSSVVVTPALCVCLCRLCLCLCRADDKISISNEFTESVIQFVQEITRSGIACCWCLPFFSEIFD